MDVAISALVLLNVELIWLAIAYLATETHVSFKFHHHALAKFNATVGIVPSWWICNATAVVHLCNNKEFLSEGQNWDYILRLCASLDLISCEMSIILGSDDRIRQRQILEVAFLTSSTSSPLMTTSWDITLARSRRLLSLIVFSNDISRAQEFYRARDDAFITIGSEMSVQAIVWHGWL